MSRAIFSVDLKLCTPCPVDNGVNGCVRGAALGKSYLILYSVFVDFFYFQMDLRLQINTPLARHL